MEDAQRMLDTIDAPPHDRAQLLSAWSNYFIAAGDLDSARVKAEAALRIARDLKNPTALALALFTLAYAVWEHEPDVALPAVEESIALTRAGAADGQYGAALVIAARLRSRAGDPNGALQGLRDAIAHSQRVGDRNNMTFALRAAMQTFIARGEATVATEIAGAFEAGAISAMNWRLGGDEAARREAAHSTMRDLLGEPAFDAAFARGAAMSYDEVSLLAIAKLDELLAAASDT
jgi:hypothetical protein